MITADGVRLAPLGRCVCRRLRVSIAWTYLIQTWSPCSEFPWDFISQLIRPVFNYKRNHRWMARGMPWAWQKIMCFETGSHLAQVSLELDTSILSAACVLPYPVFCGAGNQTQGLLHASKRYSQPL